jgi:hypothetical protein
MGPTEVAQHVPFYFDWKFWAFAVSLTALVLSQLPPLHIVFRRATLDVEAYALTALTHKVGNPNAQLHLIVRNTGGRKVRVKGIVLRFQRGEQSAFVLPAKNYLANPSDKDAVMLAPFTLKPDEEWAHIVNFLNFFAKDDEREFRRIRNNLRNDIAAKRDQLEDKSQNVTADDVNVQPALAFFGQHFVWNHGEYKVTLEIGVEPSRASIKKHFRITLFESDAQQLRDYTEGYKYGAGVVYDSAVQESVLTSLNQT